MPKSVSERNTELIEQLDDFVKGYTEKIMEKNPPVTGGTISLDTEEKVDLKALFDLKNDLVREIRKQKTRA